MVRQVGNIDEIVTSYVNEAREIVPLLEAQSYELVAGGAHQFIKLVVQLPGGRVITYSLAQDLVAFAEKFSKRVGIPVVVEIGSSPISKKSISKVGSILKGATPLSPPVAPGKATSEAVKPPAESVKDTEERKAYELWDTYVFLVKFYISEGEFDQAEIIALRALEIAESFILDDRRQGITLELITEIFFKTNQYELCGPFLIRLYEMYKRCLGADHVDTATITHNLAFLYHNWGKQSLATKYYQETIRVKTMHLGNDHPEVKNVLSQFTQLLETSSMSLEHASSARRKIRDSLRHTQQMSHHDIGGDQLTGS